MEMNGVLVNRPVQLSFASISILGTSSIWIYPPGKWLKLCASRYGGYSGPHWGRGVRSLVFHSAAPLEGIETYIMMENGSTHARVILDEYYYP